MRRIQEASREESIIEAKLEAKLRAKFRRVHWNEEVTMHTVPPRSSFEEGEARCARREEREMKARRSLRREERWARVKERVKGMGRTVLGCCFGVDVD